MSTTGENAATMCALLDAQMTSKEFDDAVARNKLLHDCKTKGFADLERLGLIENVKRREKPNYTHLEFAQMGAKMVNEQGRSIKDVCDQFGRNNADLRHFCNKFGIALKKRQKRWDYDEAFPKIQRMVNRYGYRLGDVARKLDTSACVLLRILRSKGYKYNAQTIKIRKVKK